MTHLELQAVQGSLFQRPSRFLNAFRTRSISSAVKAPRRRSSLTVEIANHDPDVALCNQTALDGALMLDRMEDEDARRQSG